MPPAHAHRSARSGEEPQLSKDTAFELLSDQRRRYVLHALLREEGVATVRELCTRIEAWEVGSDRSAIAAELREKQLPKFEAVGVVAYYNASDVVELLEPANELIHYLKLAADDDLDIQRDV